MGNEKGMKRSTWPWDSLGKNIPDSRNSKCKGPEVG